MNYDKYIHAINELEEVEQIIITEPRYKRCCVIILELLKKILQIFKKNLIIYWKRHNRVALEVEITSNSKKPITGLLLNSSPLYTENRKAPVRALCYCVTT